MKYENRKLSHKSDLSDFCFIMDNSSLSEIEQNLSNFRYENKQIKRKVNNKIDTVQNFHLIHNEPVDQTISLSILGLVSSDFNKKSKRFTKLKNFLNQEKN